MGGPFGFTKRLDTMFIQGLSSGGGSANTAGVSLFALTVFLELLGQVSFPDLVI
jgi:hypothetical protein